MFSNSSTQCRSNPSPRAPRRDKGYVLQRRWRWRWRWEWWWCQWPNESNSLQESNTTHTTCSWLDSASYTLWIVVRAQISHLHRGSLIVLRVNNLVSIHGPCDQTFWRVPSKPPLSPNQCFPSHQALSPRLPHLSAGTPPSPSLHPLSLLMFSLTTDHS
jgi:hypothetical protein